VKQKFGKLFKKIQNFWLKKRITAPNQKLEENLPGII
jgi:hypothetical protein